VTWTVDRAVDRIEIAGELRLADSAVIWKRLRACTRSPGQRLDLDLSRAIEVDGAVMALLVETRAALTAAGAACDIIGAGDRLRPVVHLYRGDEPPLGRASEAAHEGAIARLGASSARGWRRAHELAGFTGDVVAAAGAVIRHPRRANWGSLPTLLARAGSDGLPIVVLLNFLVGFVIAFQSTPQLRLFGAHVYVADVVGLTLTRELAPLMTAIIIAGRSGAAYAAELGTMRVSDEIDALRTMGCAPVPYLVLPRVVALAIAAPMLTLIGDVVGVLGGLVVGATSLDVSPTGFMSELSTAVVPSDVWTGLVKSVAFAIAIALIGCRQGLATRGAAAGVGRGTTATVVHCLFAIVLLDTLFTVVFRELGV
jgi:phospholipid/cholesterol/gamma-HCH transport system permease protein